MTDGIILVDKPGGLTSSAVVGIIKRRLNVKRVGHAGTLDPDATGLLVVLLGGATRLASFAEAGEKIYSGTIRLGVTTSTDDVFGSLISENPERPSLESIRCAVERCTGTIDQVPPQVSAIKVKGRKAYELAREGKEVMLSARRVSVSSFAWELQDADHISFRIECSKGTYIRSIARDIGNFLGCGGALGSLRREGSRPFLVSEATLLDEVTENNILPWERLFPGILRLELESADVVRLGNGDKRVLQEVTNTSVIQERSLLMYGERGSSDSKGLLLKREGEWSFGVNL